MENSIESFVEDLIKKDPPKPLVNWRRYKRIIKSRAQRLIPNVTYAMGCRGHPGLVTKRSYWPGWSLQDLFGASVEITSLIDGIEEGCSIYYCSPMPISKEEAERRIEEIKTTHDADLSVKYGYAVEEVKSWIQDWVDKGCVYYVLSEQNGHTVRSTAVLTKESADKEIERLKRFENKGVTNPRVVDMLTYPVPIKSFTI